MFENSILLHFFELGKKLVGMKVGTMVQGIDLGLEGWRAPQPPERGSTHGERGISGLPLHVPRGLLIHNRLQLPVVHLNYSRAKSLLRQLVRGSC